MCDPVSIIGIGLSVGMAAANASAQQDMVNQQNDANAQWVAYQRREAQQYAQRDEELRRNAEAARAGATEELTAPKQQAAQESEESRLKTALTPEETAAMARGDKLAIDKTLLSGQQGGDEGVKSSIQAQIQKAAQEARSRIAALAAVQSYGGSQFGLTNRANTILNTSGQDIRLASDMRGGERSAYGAVKAVEPIKIVQGGGGSSLGGLSSSFAQIGGSGLGNAMAGMIK